MNRENNKINNHNEFLEFRHWDSYSVLIVNQKENIFNIVSIDMSEEEKIYANSDRNKYRNGTQGQANRIIHATSEIRTNFTQIKVTDPTEKLRELPLKQAKERRQNAEEENRTKELKIIKQQTKEIPLT